MPAPTRLRTTRRILFTLFMLYVGSLVPALFSPALWNGILERFGAPWPTEVTPAIAFLYDSTLISAVIFLYVALRTGPLGRWQPADRSLALVLLAANWVVDVRALALVPALRPLFAIDIVIVTTLIAVSIASPAEEEGATRT